MKTIQLSVFIISVMLLVSCATQNVITDSGGEKPQGTEAVILATDAGKTLEVEVKSENVRMTPNGKKLGKMYKGDTLTVIKRVGNWIQFTNSRFDNAYIWAPSVGYEYENLYNPYFYYDTTGNGYYDIDYFHNIFSQRGQVREETPASYELFFKDIGLGSHQTTVVEVVKGTQQIVEHGITLYFDQSNDKIEKVRVDYFRPMKGYENALKKSELPLQKPAESSKSRLVWPAGELIPELTVDLERKEWDSEWFSSIWYILPQQN